jgi:hypothetical protein
MKTIYTFIYPVQYTACINYTRPNYAFSKFFLIDREKQDKILFISRSIFNQIQPNFNQFFLSRWEMHSINFVWICLVFFELFWWQTNTHTNIHTYKPRWLHNLLAEVIIKHFDIHSIYTKAVSCLNHMVGLLKYEYKNIGSSAAQPILASRSDENKSR